jgi:hypothetical protein
MGKYVDAQLAQVTAPNFNLHLSHDISSLFFQFMQKIKTNMRDIKTDITNKCNGQSSVVEVKLEEQLLNSLRN